MNGRPTEESRVNPAEENSPGRGPLQPGLPGFLLEAGHSWPAVPAPVASPVDARGDRTMRAWPLPVVGVLLLSLGVGPEAAAPKTDHPFIFEDAGKDSGLAPLV